jgi:hypothetical protein
MVLHASLQPISRRLPTSTKPPPPLFWWLLTGDLHHDVNRRQFVLLCFVFPSLEFSVAGWRSANLTLPFLNYENGDFSIHMRDIFKVESGWVWPVCLFWLLEGLKLLLWFCTKVLLQLRYDYCHAVLGLCQTSQRWQLKRQLLCS